MPSTTPDVMISAKDIHKAFGGNEVLRWTCCVVKWWP